MISELIGIPAVRRDDFRRWSSVFVNATMHTAEEYVEATTLMLDFVHELIEEKRTAPADDLLSGLIVARDGGDRLSQDELTSMVFLLLAAGHETTVSLITNGVHALLRHPDQLALLKAEPEPAARRRRGAAPVRRTAAGRDPVHRPGADRDRRRHGSRPAR